MVNLVEWGWGVYASLCPRKVRVQYTNIRSMPVLFLKLKCTGIRLYNMCYCLEMLKMKTPAEWPCRDACAQS